MGYLASLANGQVAVAARVAMLRRDAPRESPCVSALVTAELPILSVEAILAAVASFTLVGPLGLPWWLPLLILSAMATIVYGLTSLAGRGRRELWKGLAVMRSVNGRWRVIGLVLIAVLAQIARNYIVLLALERMRSAVDTAGAMRLAFAAVPV